MIDLFPQNQKCHFVWENTYQIEEPNSKNRNNWGDWVWKDYNLQDI